MDELNVTEVVSPLHFPSVKEREQSNYYAEESSASCLKPGSEVSHPSAITSHEEKNSFNAEPSPVFGMRKQHRCFVVTARSRSFLYHQVGISNIIDLVPGVPTYLQHYKYLIFIKI